MTSTKPKSQQESGPPAGIGQLTLVEHCLCPLDSRISLQKDLVHECEYFVQGQHKSREKAHVRVHCPAGISASDEFFLWGMLGVTLAQEQPSFEVQATPHYWLRQLGCVSEASKGGKTYERFREAIRRLSCVHYENDRFYDPQQGEHRTVSFGLLSYSLPMNPDSPRAWRIVWDPLFFDFLKASGSHLTFDLDLYRDLDPGSRRLFLLLKKAFWCRTSSRWFDVRHLAVNVIGFSAELETRALKAKVKRCASTLIERDVIRLPAGTSEVGELFEKQGTGKYGVRFLRGAYFESRRTASPPSHSVDPPMSEPLARIGFDKVNIQRILQRYRHSDVQVWADVTLAAMEHQGKSFFRRNPEAYFLHNIKHAAKGERTPPDWFLALRKAEENGRMTADRSRRGRGRPDASGTRQPARQEKLERVRVEGVLQEIFAKCQSTAEGSEHEPTGAVSSGQQVEG